MNRKTLYFIIFACSIWTTAQQGCFPVHAQAHWPTIRSYHWYPLNHRRTTFHPTHKISTYGGPNRYRPEWTNYYVPDTSFGYRTYRPTARSLGITAPHRRGNPNPRSLYR